MRRSTRPTCGGFSTPIGGGKRCGKTRPKSSARQPDSTAGPIARRCCCSRWASRLLGRLENCRQRFFLGEESTSATVSLSRSGTTASSRSTITRKKSCTNNGCGLLPNASPKRETADRVGTFSSASACLIPAVNTTTPHNTRTGSSLRPSPRVVRCANGFLRALPRAESGPCPCGTTKTRGVGGAVQKTRKLPELPRPFFIFQGTRRKPSPTSPATP